MSILASLISGAAALALISTPQSLQVPSDTQAEGTPDEVIDAGADTATKIQMNLAGMRTSVEGFLEEYALAPCPVEESEEEARGLAEDGLIEFWLTQARQEHCLMTSRYDFYLKVISTAHEQGSPDTFSHQMELYNVILNSSELAYPTPGYYRYPKTREDHLQRVLFDTIDSAIWYDRFDEAEALIEAHTADAPEHWVQALDQRSANLAYYRGEFAQAAQRFDALELTAWEEAALTRPPVSGVSRSFLRTHFPNGSHDFTDDNLHFSAILIARLYAVAARIQSGGPGMTRDELLELERMLDHRLYLLNRVRIQSGSDGYFNVEIGHPRALVHYWKAMAHEYRCAIRTALGRWLAVTDCWAADFYASGEDYSFDDNEPVEILMNYDG